MLFTALKQSLDKYYVSKSLTVCCYHGNNDVGTLVYQFKDYIIKSAYLQYASVKYP